MTWRGAINLYLVNYRPLVQEVRFERWHTYLNLFIEFIASYYKHQFVWVGSHKRTRIQSGPDKCLCTAFFIEELQNRYNKQERSEFGSLWHTTIWKSSSFSGDTRSFLSSSYNASSSVWPDCRFRSDNGEDQFCTQASNLCFAPEQGHLLYFNFLRW